MVSSHLALSMHSSAEPGELLKWLYHDDISIVVDITTGAVVVTNIDSILHAWHLAPSQRV